MTPSTAKLKLSRIEIRRRPWPVPGATYSVAMTEKAPPPAGDLPDLQLPERGTPLGAVSVRVTKDADLGELIAALQGAGAEIVAINTFPATRHEPGITRVLDFETRGLGSAKAATILWRSWQMT